MIKILIRVMLGSIITAILSAIAGVGASLWIAKYTSKPIIFIAAGAIVYILILIAGAKIINRQIKVRNRRTYKLITGTIGLGLMLTLYAYLLLPLPGPYREANAVAGQQFWDLPSGSSISYLLLSGVGDKSLPPVIFLHGGPGVPDMLGDSKYFGQLIEDGYDFYIYDQVGTGRSSRLKDPRGYTVTRDVEDLEFIRQKIGVEKVILIGHSYGGEVAAHYMASYGEHVERVVLISPGAINPDDKSGGNLNNRLSSEEKAVLYKTLLHPRNLMTYALLQINPLAAYEFAGDKEMDAQFDKVYKMTQPAVHARGLHIGPELSGLGFYANQMPQSATAKAKPDVRKVLEGEKTPALIIKGSADYLSWSSGIEFKKALSNNTLVYFSGAGHNTYQDKPEIVMELIRAFLQDKPLPVDAYPGIEMPKDYEGVY